MMPTAPTAAPGAARLQALACRGGIVHTVQDWVAEEVPVALQYNGLSHAVMLASPIDLEDFAYGFSLSEGLIDSAADLHDVELQRTPQGIVLQIEIASRCVARLKERRRTMAGRTGCGLCGTESLEQALPSSAGPVASLRLGARALGRALHHLRESQTLQAATGATHAAAWCSTAGDVQLLREDVGRHNALDKLVGALAANDVDASGGFIAVTSRASFEMVQKAAMAGAPLLAAVSAPTSFAVATAQRAGLTLVGFVRQQDLGVYSHPQRLRTADPQRVR